jgi:hypothetical protein
MNFEDFNYGAFNDHILLRDLEKEALEEERKLEKEKAALGKQSDSDSE